MCINMNMCASVTILLLSTCEHYLMRWELIHTLLTQYWYLKIIHWQSERSITMNNTCNYPSNYPVWQCPHAIYLPVFTGTVECHEADSISSCLCGCGGPVRHPILDTSSTLIIICQFWEDNSTRRYYVYLYDSITTFTTQYLVDHMHVNPINIFKTSEWLTFDLV